MSTHRTIKQHLIIQQWIREAAEKYNTPIDQITDDQIVSYLAQKEIDKQESKAP